MRRALVVAAFAIGCGGKQEVAPVVVAAPPPPSSIAVTDAAAPKAARRARPIVLAGPRAVQNARWVDGGYAALLTSFELWRVRPEDPTNVHVSPLASRIGPHPVLAS